MSLVDPIADLLTIIRNGLLVKKKFVKVPYSKIKESIVSLLIRLGFLSSYSIEEIDEAKKKIVIQLKYVNKTPAIIGLKRQSKSSRRLYSSRKVRVGSCPQHSISILSTSKGILSDKEAYKENVGGEVLCTIW